MATTADLRRVALWSLIPPPRLQLSDWIEANIKLPEGVSALPGAIRLYPYQRDIADAIRDGLVERVTMVKAARLGFTALLSGAVGAYIANEPTPDYVPAADRALQINYESACFRTRCAERRAGARGDQVRVDEQGTVRERGDGFRFGNEAANPCFQRVDAANFLAICFLK
jgi:hypothetical protein